MLHCLPCSCLTFQHAESLADVQPCNACKLTTSAVDAAYASSTPDCTVSGSKPNCRKEAMANPATRADRRARCRSCAARSSCVHAVIACISSKMLHTGEHRNYEGESGRESLRQATDRKLRILFQPDLAYEKPAHKQ